MKLLLISLASLIRLLYRYYIRSPVAARFVKLARHPRLRPLTLPVSEAVNRALRKHNVPDDQFEEQVRVLIEQCQAAHPYAAPIYQLQRQSLFMQIIASGDEMLLDEDLDEAARYFAIRLKRTAQ